MTQKGRMPPPLPNRKPNPLNNRPPIKAPPPPLVRQAAAGAAAAAKLATRPAKRTCVNKECATPDIQDGICHNCGFVADDSNIVSEVSFGETSSGAAVVQGSFVSADQSGARSLGPAFRNAGTGEERESTIREGRRIMQGLAGQLGIIDGTLQSAVQIFKLAAMNNFIQGRRMDMVCAVCLYSACRKEKPCRVMLIDFADKVQANVFKLGHTFKGLHNAVTMAKEGIQPVLPEDLIYRFAMKLEFGNATNKVAEDAVRMVKRMSLDWMVMGRRPSGVCGACLILAARMNNFRRTITEVVYIVKVTTHTIQKRLEEFKQTPSSALTVEEFLHNEFLESAHDPPSFYERTDEFQKTKKRRKRKTHENLYGDDDSNSEGEGETPSPNKRQKTVESTADSSSETPGRSTIEPAGSTTSANTTPNPDTPAPITAAPTPAVELRRDADGFVIPPQPTQSHDIVVDPDLVDLAIEDESGTSFEKLVNQFGDAMDPEAEALDDTSFPSTPTSTAPKRSRPIKDVAVSEAWSTSEQLLEDEITEMISDPNTVQHATSYAQAKHRAAAHMLIAEQENPSKNISMDVHIGEDEFKNDPEVMNCMLSPADVARKEKVWVNENKNWLRKQQAKMWAKKNAENGPPKAKRNRKKKPRIGEGQTSAASSPGEAAVNALKQRAFSKKINYDAIKDMFAGLEKMTDKSALGSAGTSRITSRAGSEMGESDSESVSSVAQSGTGSVVDSEAGDDTMFIGGPRKKPKKQLNPHSKKLAAAAATKTYPKLAPSPQPSNSNEQEEEEDDEPGSDDDDYVKPTPAAPAAKGDDGEDEEEETVGAGVGGEWPEEDDDYDGIDYGGIEAGGLEDLDVDVDGIGASLDDEDDGYE